MFKLKMVMRMKRINFVGGIIMMMLAFSVNASAKYKVGQIYDEDGLKGLVVYVDDSGEHGLLMSLESSGKKWLDDKDEKFNTGAFYEDDGEKNMAALQKFIDENGKTWELFPLFEWARSLGVGWYIPAVDELKHILNAINGGEGKFNSKYMKPISKVLKKAKGDKLMNTGFGGTNAPHSMMSSTEADGGMVYTLFFLESAGSAILGNKTPKGKFHIEPRLKNMGGKIFHHSRAVHKF